MDTYDRIYDTLRSSGQQDLLMNWMLGGGVDVERKTGMKGNPRFLV